MRGYGGRNLAGGTWTLSYTVSFVVRGSAEKMGVFERFRKMRMEVGEYILEVVDFCSGANDFSFLTKNRVDEMGKKRCTYNVVSLQGIGLRTAFGLQQRIDESKETTSALKLLRKIRQLEHLHVHIKQNICKRRSVSQLADGALDLCEVMEPFALKLTTESRVFEYNAFCFAVVLRRCCSGGCVGFLVGDSGFYLFVALLVLYKINLDDYEEPRVLVTCRSREEFCLVTRLRFGAEYCAEYNNEDDYIPFRRQVFSSAKDGKPIIGKMVEKLITSEFFDRLPDDDVVSLCCVGILQFVLLSLEDRRGILDWILRDANVRRWPSLYAIEPRRDVDKKMYSIFGFTWAFKDMSVGPVRQPNKGTIIVDQHYGLSDFSEFQSLQGDPSSFSTQGNSSFFEGAQATPFYGHNMATPNWQTLMPSHPGTSNWQTQMPSHSATPNWQTPMASYPHDAGLFNPNILNRARREFHPSMYKRTPYMDLPPTTVVPKKRGDKTKNKVKNANLSPLNLGNAFADDNVGGDDVMFLGEHDTSNCLVYENVDPSKKATGVKVGRDVSCDGARLLL
ncbi:hypothetical protein Tco_0206942 [Tanacetum coccineum]